MLFVKKKKEETGDIGCIGKSKLSSWGKKSMRGYMTVLKHSCKSFDPPRIRRWSTGPFPWSLVGLCNCPDEQNAVEVVVCDAQGSV